MFDTLSHRFTYLTLATCTLLLIPGCKAKEEAAAKVEASPAPPTKVSPHRTPEPTKPAKANAPQGERLRLRVVDVKSNDALNLREQPDPKSAIITTIPHDAKSVEALNETKKVGASNWMRVQYGGKQGWVNAKFLVLSTAKPGPAGTNAPGGESVFAEDLKCSGEEPFWSLSLSKRGAVVFESMDGAPVKTRLQSLEADKKTKNRWKMSFRGKGNKNFVAEIKKTGKCRSTMADHLRYHYEIRVTGAYADPVKGCCNRIK